MKNQNLIRIIEKGGVVVLPTDTLYGICASAFSKKTVEKIYEIKGRDEQKPFIILISKIEDLKKFGIKLTKDQKNILEKLWPNKVSVILACTSKKYSYLHRGTCSLAFRFPKKKSVLKILDQTGPLVAPSANPQGLSPARNIAEAKKYFGNQIDLYISGRTVLSAMPSTIVKLYTPGLVEILRQGNFKVPKDLISQ